MRFVSLSLVLAFAGTATAQQIVNETLTAAPWSHTASGTWKNGIAEPRSLYNTVDHLVSADTFTYTRNALVLDPGTYIAVARFAKITAAAGTADIDVKVLATGSTSLKVPVSDQTVDSFIHSKALLFTLDQKLPVLFMIENTDTTTKKADYLFDSFHVGKVELGRAVLVESMGRRWGHAWGAPHYCKEHPDNTAAFGFVERLNPRNSSNCGTGQSNLWWFDWTSPSHSFLPGIHTVNLKIKKVVNASGAHDFDVWVQKSTDNGATWTSDPKVEWKASDHIIDQWVYSPNISFNVATPTDLYRFRFSRTGGTGNSFKADYYFDTCEVRRGEYTSVGSSCLNNGTAIMKGNVPQRAHDLNIEVGPLGSVANVTMILGATNPNFDLSVVGAPNCWQHASLDVLVGMNVASGVATLTVPIPNQANVIGVTWYTQAFDPTATKIATTNGVRGYVGN